VIGTPVMGENRGGGLVKTGAGRLTIDGSACFPGPVRVEQGTLEVNGDASASTGGIAVEAGATLAGSGTIGGPVRIAAGAALDPGGPAGELIAADDLTLDGTLSVELDEISPGRLQVAGHLSLRGARLAVRSRPGPGPRSGSLVIASYGSIEGRFAKQENLPPGCVLDYRHGGRNQVALVFTGEANDAE
jgi:autotransporter-associated beta strand protein